MYWAERNDPAVTFANHGVNRERTDQIAQRLEAALDGAQAIVLQGGINDIVQKRALDLVVEDIDAMIRKAPGARAGACSTRTCSPGTTATAMPPRGSSS